MQSLWTTQKNNNRDKSDSCNCFIACGGDVSGGYNLGAGSVFLSCAVQHQYRRLVQPAGFAGQQCAGHLWGEQACHAETTCTGPPSCRKDFQCKETGEWTGCKLLPRRFRSWLDRPGTISVPCHGQSFTKMCSAQWAGWWTSARESRKFPHLCFFSHVYRNPFTLRLDLDTKEGCVTWKRLIFQWNKESRNILLQLLCYMLTLPSMGTTAPTTHHFLPLQKT